MVEKMGLEPTTLALQVRRSTLELLPRKEPGRFHIPVATVMFPRVAFASTRDWPSHVLPGYRRCYDAKGTEMERVSGNDPPCQRWQRRALPLSYTRIKLVAGAGI